MEYIRVTNDNLEKEHICCAIYNNKDVQVSSKKAWLADRFDEGLVFLKSVERGKCFIEYIPAENAWVPINADGYMYIDCLWVSGSFKGHGYSTELLDACIEDSKEKGKKGLCILAAAKKKPFLADPKFLKYKGFTQAKKDFRYDNDLCIDYSSRQIFWKQNEIELTKSEFDIVELLSTYPGQVFDREMIYERLWGFDRDGDNKIVTELIRRIRNKLKNYTEKDYIETVWGCGYKWASRK